MTEGKLESLKQALHGAEPPAGLEQLEDDQIEALTRAINHLSEQQEQALQQAMVDALDHLPAMLRKPVRRAFFS